MSIRLAFMLAMHSLWQYKWHSLVNILGLSVGLTASLIIWIFANYESSFDRVWEKDIYRLAFGDNRSEIHVALASAALKPVIEESYKNLVNDTTLIQAPTNNITVIYENRRLLDIKAQAAEGNIEEFFPLNMLHGRSDVLEKPNYVIISTDRAQSLFGSTNVIGSTLELSIGKEKEVMIIGGVFPPLPKNSHLTFDLLFSVKTLEKHWPYAFTSLFYSNNFALYIKLLPGVSPQLVEQQLDLLYRDRSQGGSRVYELQPITQIHLNPKQIGEFKQHGSARLVNVATVLTMIILLITAFNFVNFFTAQGLRRAEEIGVHKALGASRYFLVIKFYFEVFAIVLMALAIAFLLSVNGLSVLKMMVGRDIGFIFNFSFSLIIVLVVLSFSLLAGAYPAFYLSTFKPKEILSGKLDAGKQSVYVRRILVLIQSIAAISLMSLSIIAYQEIKRLENQSLGFSPDGVWVTSLLETDTLLNSFEGVRTRLIGQGYALSIALAEQVPTMPFNMKAAELFPDGVVSQRKIQDVPLIGASVDIAKTLGLQLLAGRDFSVDYSGDHWRLSDDKQAEAGLLINHATVIKAGWEKPDDAIGQLLEFEWFGIKVTGRIVGVVDDFMFSAQHNKGNPLIFVSGFFYQGDAVFLARQDESLPSTENKILKLLEEMYSVSSLTLSNLSRLLQSQHEPQRRQLRILISFMTLAIFLTSFGLLGLTVYITEQRSHEIAVRRVLGAGKNNIIMLLSKEYLILSAAAAFLAVPVTKSIMEEWFGQSFLHADISWSLHIIAPIILIILTWCTVVIGSLVSMSPILSDTLRSE